MFPEAPPPKKKNLVCLTYGVTIGLLIIGQLQVLACVELLVSTYLLSRTLIRSSFQRLFEFSYD